MLLLAVGALLGASMVALLPVLPNLWILFFVFLWSLFLAYFWRKQGSLLLLGFVAGFFWVTFVAYHQQQQKIPITWQGKNKVIRGHIVTIPAHDSLRDQFIFQTNPIKEQSYRLQLSWYRPPKGLKLKVGDYWQLALRLKRPHGLANPGGFDYEKYLFAQHINATGYVVNNGRHNRLLASHWYHQPQNRVRQWLLKAIQKHLPPQQALSHFIVALTIGYRQQFTASQWQVLQHTGTAHLMAISGLHIGLVAGLIFFLVSWLWRRSRYLTLKLPAAIAAAWGAWLAALLYSLMAGLSLPTQRALIMLSVVLLAVILRRKVMPWQSLAWALIVVLLIEPLSVLSASFWLSFTAVVVILCVLYRRWQSPSRYGHLLQLQGIIWLGLMPLSLLVFNQTSLISPLVNLLAIPWVGFVVIPLSLLACLMLLVWPAAATVLLWLALKNLQGLWFILAWLAKQPFVAWQYQASMLALGSFLVFVLLLLLPSGFPGRAVAGFFLLPLLFPTVKRVGQGDAVVTLLDVGQGFSAVVQTAHHTLVFDTGAKFSPQSNAAERVLLPFLHQQGVRQVDRLLLSHGDSDHTGGAQTMLQQMPVIAVNGSQGGTMDQRAILPCFSGQRWQWDGVRFEILYPPRHLKNCGNDCSCVLKVTVGQESVLFTGDIERPAEDYLLKYQSSLLPATVLFAPHHGSKTSSSAAFISAVDPKIVLFAVGYANRFSFPSLTVLQRYQRQGVIAYSTADSGAIQIKLQRDEVKIQRYRQQNRKIWR